MQNKVLNRYLLPYYIGSAFFIVVAGTSVDLARKDSKIAEIVYQEALSFNHSNTNHFLCVILIILSCMLGWFGLVSLPKQAQKRANEITADFLHEMFAAHPELKQYEHVLQNPQTLKYICALACNGLSKSEQKLILKEMNTALNSEYKSEQEEKMAFSMAEKAVFDIVKKHSKKHPMYIQVILSAIKNAHKTYVMSANEKSR